MVHEMGHSLGLPHTFNKIGESFPAVIVLGGKRNGADPVDASRFSFLQRDAIPLTETELQIHLRVSFLFYLELSH